MDMTTMRMWYNGGVVVAEQQHARPPTVRTPSERVARARAQEAELDRLVEAGLAHQHKFDSNYVSYLSGGGAITSVVGGAYSNFR